MREHQCTFFIIEEKSFRPFLSFHDYSIETFLNFSNENIRVRAILQCYAEKQALDKHNTEIDTVHYHEKSMEIKQKTRKFDFQMCMNFDNLVRPQISSTELS